LKEADVLVVHIDVDKPPKFSLLVIETLPEAGKPGLQVLQHPPESFPMSLAQSGVAGE